jgi:hypothetical protein
MVHMEGDLDSLLTEIMDLDKQVTWFKAAFLKLFSSGDHFY